MQLTDKQVALLQAMHAQNYIGQWIDPDNLGDALSATGWKPWKRNG